ncbi:MAG: aminotransferase class III-fold pyridoxal phosphate-dependent enzyme [Dehalococcoidia bacterium]
MVKFRGCYHGHTDSLLVDAGSGALTLGIPGTPGTPGAAADTLVAEFNDAASVERLLEANRGEVAAVVIEPVAGNMGVVAPEPASCSGFGRSPRRTERCCCSTRWITGFRVGPGGAQALYGVTPDLTILGKIIGGGMPVGAYGGRRDLMAMIAPSGVPGGHARRNRRRWRPASPRCAPWPSPAFTTGWRRPRPRWSRTGRRGPVGRRRVDGEPGRIAADAVLRHGAGDRLRRGHRVRHDALRRLPSGDAGGGVYLPPSQFEAWLPPRRTARPRWTPPSTATRQALEATLAGV